MKHSLLIVEDDEATAAFLADNLAADGFGVACASGAAEGIRALEVRHPALVLLDLGLEEGHGLDLLDRVRAADASTSRFDPDLPVIVVTGRASEADRVRGFARGADDYLVKPFHYGELLGLAFKFQPPSAFKFFARSRAKNRTSIMPTQTADPVLYGRPDVAQY
ncbi:MAG: response regulator [Thermoleophilaceae bacterium]|nr:response regulator [Thermoleophilaceae bacterium]